jgi:hypothetical protein
MSEQPAQYGDHPVPAPLVARVDAVERQIAQNASAISGLINAVDGLRASVDRRLTAIERQLVALNENNKLLAELIIKRLPDPK